MKWFKHDTDGNRSEGLAELRTELGWEWLARWYVLLEMVAEKMDKSDRCHAEYPLHEWCRYLECKPQKLRSFLVLIENKLNCTIEDNGNKIKISIPNLLKKKDEYSESVGRNSRHVSGETPPKKEKEKEMSANADISKKKKETTGVVSESEDARATNPPPAPVEKEFPPAVNAHTNGKHPPDKFLEQAQEFLERVQDYVPLNQNDISGIRFDLNLHGKPDQLAFILDQLQAAKTDGRLNASPGIANPVGWIRKQIQEEIKDRDAAAVT